MHIPGASLRITAALVAAWCSSTVAAQTVVYVNAAAAPGGNGASWATAYNSLRTGFDAARAISLVGTPTQVWIAAGTYKPSSPLPQGGSRTANFAMVPGMSLYGGFAGTETSLAQRLIAANPTIISGDLNGDDAGELNLGDNTSVPMLTVFGPNAEINGLIITASNAANGHGGVALSGPGPVTMRDCRVVANRGTGTGGGTVTGFTFGNEFLIERCIYANNRSTGTSAGALQMNSAWGTIRQCDFVENIGTSPTRGGGAVHQFNSGRVYYDRCLFLRNTAPLGGGFGAFSNTEVYLYRCQFVGNTAGFGGAVHCPDRTNLTLVESLFAGNRATSGNGAVFNSNEGFVNAFYSFTRIYNCTFASNVSGGPSGTELAGALGTVNLDGHTTTVDNSVFWGNTSTLASGREAQISHRGSASILEHNSIQGYSAGYGTGVQNDAADPMFLRSPSPGLDGGYGTTDDDYGDLRPGVGSGALDSGSDSLLPADRIDMDGDGNTTEVIPLDLVGLARLVDDPATVNLNGTQTTLDRGAYEIQVNCPSCPGTRDWRSPSGGNWNIVANWNPAVPAADSDTVFDLASSYTVTFDPAGVPGTGAASRAVNSMTVSSGSVTLDLNQTALDLSASLAPSLTIGSSPAKSAALAITDGTVTAFNARIAATTTNTAPSVITDTLTVGAGGSLLVSRSLDIGIAGRGVMNIVSGGHVTSRDATIGDQPGSNGLVSVSGAGSTWDIPFFCIIDNGELNVSNQGAVSVGAGIPFTGIFLLNDGRISGDGTINGNVVNFGRITPGNSPGTLTINGGYAQVGQIQDLGAFSGTLELEVGGAGPGQFDRLAVNAGATSGGGPGQVSLGGGLLLNFMNNFQPGPTDSFLVLDAGAAPIDGQFDVAFFPALTAAPVQGKFMRAVYAGLRGPGGPGGSGITVNIADLPPSAGFGSPQTTSLLSAPAGAAAGDLDRDGDLDIAVALPSGMATGAIAILVNDGTGNFATTQISSGGIDPRAIAIANFDGTNGNDLAVINRESSPPEVRILRQQPAPGVFGNPSVITLPAGSRPGALAAADLDPAAPGNMGVDLAITSEEPANDRGSITIAHNMGTGGGGGGSIGFLAIRVPMPQPMVRPLDIRPINPDRDKDGDLAAAFNPDNGPGLNGALPGGIALIANVGGTGIFGPNPPIAVVSTGAEPVQLLAGALGVGGADPVAGAAGGEDLVTVNRGLASAGGQSVSVLRNIGDFDETNPSAHPGFAPAVAYPITFDGATGPTDPRSIALADLDDDDDLDIAVIGSVSAAVRRIKVLRNDSTQQTIGAQSVRQIAFAPQVDQQPSGDCPERVLAGDVSGDGRKDLITINASCNRGVPGSVVAARNTLAPLGDSLGACCRPPALGGACSLATVGACTNRGDTFQGALTACAPSNPCPRPPAACCRGSMCVIADSTACAAFGPFAAYAGAGTSCNAPGNLVSPCCAADFNHSGAISVQDIFDFLGAYFSGDFTLVDINRSGTLSVQDIFDFLAAYFVGCA